MSVHVWSHGSSQQIEDGGGRCLELRKNVRNYGLDKDVCTAPTIITIDNLKYSIRSATGVFKIIVTPVAVIIVNTVHVVAFFENSTSM